MNRHQDHLDSSKGTAENLAEELKAISFYFAYQRTVGGFQFTYADEMRAKNKVYERIARRQLEEAWSAAIRSPSKEGEKNA